MSQSPFKTGSLYLIRTNVIHLAVLFGILIIQIVVNGQGLGDISTMNWIKYPFSKILLTILTLDLIFNLYFLAIGIRFLVESNSIWILITIYGIISLIGRILVYNFVLASIIVLVKSIQSTSVMTILLVGVFILTIPLILLLLIISFFMTNRFRLQRRQNWGVHILVFFSVLLSLLSVFILTMPAISISEFILWRQFSKRKN